MGQMHVKAAFAAIHAIEGHHPDYRVRFDREEDQLTTYLRSHKGGLREFKDMLGLR
jgi:hypothetical protein